MTCSSFKGKVVLITGSSSGIGAGIAEEFARQGANLVLTGRNVDGLQETKNKCLKLGLKENQIVFVAGELTDDEVPQKLIDAAIANFGQLDVLVNNAGMSLEQPIMELTIEGFDKIYNVNLRSTVAVTMLGLPHLVKTKGNVVNVSSIASYRPIQGGMSYCISKAGMDMLTKSLAFEMAPQGVRVNSVNPGGVPTNIGRDHKPISEEEKAPRWKAAIAMHPIGRLGQVKEIADAVVFLASERATFITGQILSACGGLGIRGVNF